MVLVRTKPVTGEIYHLYNRGVEKRDVFVDSVDYIRFIHDLFEFNDTKPAPAFERRYKTKGKINSEETREKLVEILCFCLMPNHYHFLARQLKENGISLFMQKLGTGYTKAFNEKNNRVGPLFQGKYKLKHVDKDEYLQHLVCYIHFNPLKFVKTQEALKKYRWSSHRDYLGEDNFASVIEKSFLLEFFGDHKGYERFAKDWMKYQANNIDFISSTIIDYD